MANSIAYTKNYTAVLDEVYKRAACSTCLNSPRRMARAGRNAKEIMIPKIEVTGLGDYTRNVGYKTGSITYEFETKTFNYDRGIKLLADVMDVEEAGVLDCFVAAGSELQRTQVAPEADAFTFSEIAGHEGVTPVEEDFADADAEAQGQNAPAPFYDVSESWALPFIAYCAQNEIVAGSSGRFRPADHVTLRELAKMLLVLLGEDSARYVGAGWAQNVDQDAFEKGIYAGLTAGYEEDATRDNACLLIYNATLCPKVANASENSVQRYVLDALMNPMSYLEIRFGLTRYTATLTGNECADLTGSSPLPAGTSKLAGHKAFQVSTDLSLLGRSVDIYVKDGKVFGVPCYAVDEIYYTFADASQLKEICQGGGFRLTDETEYYYNYARSSKEILNAVTANDKITVIDHDGDNAFDVVLATSPLTVDVGGQGYEVQAFSQADTFAVGDAVYYSQVCGSGYIRRLNG